MGQYGFADQFFARVVGGGAIAVAGVLTEIVAGDHDDIDPLDLFEDGIDDADARRDLDLDHDQYVVVGVGGVALAPELAGLAAAGAPMTPGLGIRELAITNRELGEHDRIARFLNRLDHRDDDPQGTGVDCFLDVADVRRGDADERDATGFGDDLDQLLRFTPRQRAVLHFDPDEILPFAGCFRGLEVGL